MSKKHLVLMMLMSFVGGLAGSLILSTLRPIEAIATQQQQKEISVSKILFYDETGSLKGEIKGYKGGLGLSATDDKSNKKVWIELNSIEGSVYGGRFDTSGLKESYIIK